MSIFIKALEWYFCSLLVTLPLIGLLSAAQAAIRWVKIKQVQRIEETHQPNAVLT